MDNIKFITIQKIYASFPRVYSYLKQHGCNTYLHAFFILEDTTRNVTPTESLVMILSRNGNIYYLIPCNDTFELERVRDSNIISQAVTILDREVNGRHPYLRETLKEYLMEASGTTDRPQALF